VYCVDHLLSPEISRDLIEELADEFKRCRGPAITVPRRRPVG
jgi:hypothetical protein